MQIEPDPQSIDDALDWYSAITDSITAHRAVALSAINLGTAVSAQFVGLTVAEVEDFFQRQQAEVDGMCIINIVAAAEAAIRADYRDRVRRNGGDPLSRRYVTYHRALSGAKIYRPDFDKGGILEEMRSSGVVALHLVSDFRHVLNLRHWYAHGRYWLLKTNATDDPLNVHAICTILINAIAQA